MRRPLFLVSLCLVLTAALRLAWNAPLAGWEGKDVSHLPREGETLVVAGRVYQKENQRLYLKDVVIPEDTAIQDQTIQKFQLSAVNLQQQIPNQYTAQYHNKEKNQTEDRQGRTNEAARGDIRGQKAPGRFICKLSGENAPALEESVPLGSLVLVSGTFRAFSGAGNPGEFDQSAYYRTLSVCGSLEDGRVLAKSEGFWQLREGLYRLKMYWRQRLYRIFPEKEASVMCAMLLGDKTELDSEVKELYKRNGIIHILSISGLHITMIGMGIYKALRKTGLPVWCAALLGGGVLGLYGVMTGLGVSACRAIGMYLIRMLGEIMGRSYDMLTAAGVAGAVTVLINPLYLHHAGFLLSYGAVLGIGLLMPLLRTEKRKVPPGKYQERKWRAVLLKKGQALAAGLKESVGASLAITAATMPVLLWFYYEIPVYSVFLNLLVLPLMKPVMGAGMLAMLVPGFGWAGILNRVILGGYEILCRVFEKFPFHSWNPGQPAAWQIAAYYLLLGAWALLPRFLDRMRGKESAGKSALVRILRCGICVCAVIILGLHALPEDKVTFLDVGQGDSICISTRGGENYLFDCGSSSRSRVGKYILIPFLKQQGISHLDAVFVSHPDKDHISGIEELLKEGKQQGITVGALVLPDIREQGKEAFAELIQEMENGKRVQYIRAGDSFGTKDFRAVCLHPPGGYHAPDTNAYSECFYVEMKSGLSVLLTGDVEGEGEQLLIQELKKRSINEVTILKTAHHGSKNSTGAELLAVLRPAMAVISCGRDNSYGHPHREVTQRLGQAGVPFVQTSETGAVTVTPGRKGITVRTYKQ